MSTDDTSREDTSRRAGPLVLLGVVAAGLVALGWLLPLWVATLHAPQYPGGLTMEAFGHKVTGDVDEISGLNHYVGMRPFDPADFPEMALWPYALGVAVVAVVLALVVRRPLVRWLALAYLWGTPFGVLAVIQYRLHQYGTDLEPGAALRLDPFTPWVVGPTKVWNFVTWSWPGGGLLAILAAAALVTFGPRLVQRVWPPSRVSGAAVALLAVPALLLTGAPAASASGDAGDLQAILSAAEPGQTIVLPVGTYRGNVVIDTPVVLEGQGRPVVVGDHTGSVITIRAPGTVVRGITVRGSGPGPTGNPAGITVQADHVTVEDVVVEDSYMGISVESAEGIRLVGNTIQGRAHAAIGDDSHAVEHDAGAGAAADDPHAHHDHGVPASALARGDGIWLYDVDGVLVRGNTILDARDGIYLSFGTGALIDGNLVADSRYAVHSMFTESFTLVENHFRDNLSGAVLMYRGPVLMLRNHIERSTSASTGFAVLLKDVVGAEAVENVLIDNRVGIHLDGPAGAEAPSVFQRNTVARNAIGVSAYPSAHASFSGNSFVDNLVQVVPQGGRLRGLAWSAQGFGNFWSTYRGYDALGQGRGAVPHLEGGSVDRLLARNPELMALANSPGLRLLRTIEERWGRREPVLVDEQPITVPLSPAVPVPEPEPAAGLVAAGAGVLLLVPPLLLLMRPRRWVASARRAPHAVPA